MAAGEPTQYVIPPRLWSWLGSQRTLSILLWLAALGTGGYLLHHAMHWFDDRPDAPPERRRGDGNNGHMQIDFGGQWLMARTLVTGHGRELYHRQRHWEIAREGFRVENEMPLVQEEALLPTGARIRGKPDDILKHDADRLMGWCMGKDSSEWKTVGGAAALPLGASAFGDPLVTAARVAAASETVTPRVVEEVTTPAIGGALYPPVQALLYAPLGAIANPQTAYRVAQVLGAIAVIVAALGVSVLSRGRIRCSVAALVLFLFSGTRAGLDLGQNPTVSLAIVVWGWALASRGYAFAGGMVWGLFAFKPVWGLAFFLVPLLGGRWRFCAGVAVSGLALVALTIPFVGVQSWLDWLQVGQEAAELYKVNSNWIHFSRDLQGIPRRVLHDFKLPEAQRETALAANLAWGLWGTVFLLTVAIYLRCADRKRSIGVGAAFVFFGAYLTCYRFMYYDAILIAMGLTALLAEPGRFFRPWVFSVSPTATDSLAASRTLPTALSERPGYGPRWLGYVSSFPLTMLALLLLYENALNNIDFHATFGFGYYAKTTTAANGTTGLSVPKVEFDTGVDYPWETFGAVLLWAWCGWCLLRGAERTRTDSHGEPTAK